MICIPLINWGDAMTKAASIWIVFLLCLLAPAAAQAQVNQISTISVTPAPAAPGQAVTITVDIVGSCKGGYILNFGDGSPPAVKGGVMKTSSHAYATTGTYTLKATPTVPNLPGVPPECGGEATVSLPVLPASELSGGTGALFCFADGCNPKISTMALSILEPGGTAFIQGSGFGITPGSVWMVLQSYGNLFPPLRTQLQIFPGYWQPGLIIASIPAGISGVIEQSATFQVITGDSAASNGFNAPFVPADDYVNIDASRIGCSLSAHTASDQCQSNGSTNSPFECFQIGVSGKGPSPTGFSAYHGSGWQLSAGANDAGNDTFYLTSPLQNGWLLSDAELYQITWTSGTNSFAYILNPPNLYFGGPTANPSNWQIGWNVSGCSELTYDGSFNIYGPKGVPY